MIPLVAAVALLGTPSLVGEWRVWRLTEGDVAVDPPASVKGKLVVNKDGSFAIHTVIAIYGTDTKGTYSMHENRIRISGTSTFTNNGQKDSSDPESYPLVYKDGVLFDGMYNMGGSSYAYSRSVTMPEILRNDKEWPGLGEIFKR
jgi:hypothetical protein